MFGGQRFAGDDPTVSRFHCEVKISPEVAGEIIELTVREGSSVRKGDLLVRIKVDNYKYQVEQQEANLVAAKATAVQAKAQL